MQRDNKNSRLSFIRKVSLGMVSVFGLSWAAMSSKSTPDDNSNFNLISDEEANDLIKNMPTPKSKGLRPLPPPNSMESKGDE